MAIRKSYIYLILVLIIVSTVTTFTIFYPNQNPTVTAVNVQPLEFVNIKKPLDAADPTPTIENLPEFYVDDERKTRQKFNDTCAIQPDLFNLKFAGDTWQTQHTIDGTFHFFNAYFDAREFTKVKYERPLVRVLGNYNRYMPNTTFYCQFWYDWRTAPAVVKSGEYIRIWVKGWGGDRDGFFNPYLVPCEIPEVLVNGTSSLPVSVSLVDDPCANATTNLKIVNVDRRRVEKDEDGRKDFVVCVKGLNFPYSDKTNRLVEWIELLKNLGASKIHFYEFHVHPNVKMLLDYYTDSGLVEVTPITLIGDVSNSPQLQDRFLRKKVLERRLQEVIPYNDCLYKHLYDYKYIVLLDTDEVIAPKTGNWADMLKKTINPKDPKVSYMARNVYFLDNQNHEHEWFEGIPEFLHILQHVYRSVNYTKPGAYVKGFHDSNRAVALHNHFPIRCDGYCSSQSFDLELAHMQHYRTECVKELKNCKDLTKNSVKDTRVWNFKDEVVAGVMKTLGDLGFLQKIS